MEVWTKRCRKASLREEMMVPKKVERCRKPRLVVPEGYWKAMAGVPVWYLKAMGAEKRDLGCWKGTGKRRLG